jgi:protein-disulfide isomerase
MNKMMIIAAAILILAIAGFFLLGGPTGYIVKEYKGNVKGAENARVTIIEYSDFECPFCSQAVQTMDDILKKYPNDVKLVFKHFPLEFHPQAEKAAEAAECAADQGKFWEYHDTLFANQKNLDVSDLKNYAKQLGLNTGEFNACLDSGAMASRVESNRKEGAERGVRGTPTFFVNGQSVVGVKPFDVFDTLIQQALAKS